ncbi:hypothetical protein V2J09_020345 [Rumex salicifolius]
MGRSPCCVDSGLKKGPWTQEEDDMLTSYIQKHGHGSWRALPKNAGLNRCGKSCRLRWTNYLRPDIKRGRFSEEEEQLIIKLHSVLGNKWSRIAGHLPGRTDNEIKNYWNTHLRKKLLQMGIDPVTHMPRSDLSLFTNLSQILSLPMNSNTTSTPIMNNFPYDHINAFRLQSNATELAKLHVLQNLIQILHTRPNPSMDNPNTLLGSLPYQNNNNTNSPFPMNTIGVYDAVVPSSSMSLSQDMMAMNKYENASSGIGYGALEENKLPGLVSAISAEQGLSANENMESNANSTHTSAMESLPDYDFFDGWDKLIDDGTSDFLWNDLLN